MVVQSIVTILLFRKSLIEVPRRVTLRGVWMEVNGTIKGAEDITIEDSGELYLWSYAHTDGNAVGTVKLENISIRAGGKCEALTADGSTNKMVIDTTRFIVNGYGYFRTNELHLKTGNLTIDLSGR